MSNTVSKRRNHGVDTQNTLQNAAPVTGTDNLSGNVVKLDGHEQHDFTASDGHYRSVYRMKRFTRNSIKPFQKTDPKKLLIV
jgi:hypothetical protein